MHRRKLYFSLATAGVLILVVIGIALALPQPAKAQCGSQASSCKNCHEVQAQDPVNADGTGWHESHAFGDFCYICHAGNNQATDKVAAHTGMVAPLADTQAACQQCHPNDLDARSQVYASALGVKLTSAAAPAPQLGAPAATATPAGVSQAASEPAAPAPASDSTSLVNYVQRYNENALGQSPANWGNIILLVLIAAMVVGGGGLIITREGLVRVSFKDTKPVTGDYPIDVVDMVPDLAKLKPTARKTLQHLLKKPSATAELLAAVDKLTHEDKQD